jgi:hypothetical protein
MGSRNRLLVGQIAIELGFVTKEQLQECIDHQAGQVQAKPIGTLLIESGFLTQERLAAVIEEQKKRLQESLPYAPTQRGAVAFGRLLVERGLVKQEHVNEALRAQQDLADRGIRRRLGEMLVESEHLSPEAVPEILRIQGKVLMACTFCGAHFNVLLTIAEGYPCRKCGMPLDRKTGIVSADETAYLLPAIDSRPRKPSPDTVRREAAAIAAAAAPPRIIGKDFLYRLARILTIIGVLTLALYLLTKDWE